MTLETTTPALRVVELVTSVQLGGAENVAFHLAESCRAPDLEISVAELRRSDTAWAVDRRQKLHASGIATTTLSPLSGKAALLLAPVRLFQLLRRTRPSIVHSHTDLPDLVLANALRLLAMARIPRPSVVRTIHNVKLWPTHPGTARNVERAFHGDRIAAVSQAALLAYESLRAQCGLEASPHRELIYNGCPVPVPGPPPFQLEKGFIHAAFCGRFDQQKGVDVLVRRIRELRPELRKRFKIHFLGNGALEPEIRKLSESCPEVQLHPPSTNLSSILHAFDLLLMPSRFEGLPLVSIESSLSGTPVAASWAPGLDETLPADWPLRYSLESAAEFESVLERVASGSVDLERIGQTAREFALQRFSFDAMITAYDRLYRRLAPAQGPGSR